MSSAARQQQRKISLRRRRGSIFLEGLFGPSLPTVLVLALLLSVAATGQVAARESTRQAIPSDDAPEVGDIAARSWALTDAETGLYLAGKNSDERLAIASTTKVMTALVALKEGVDLDEQVTVSKQAESYVGFVYSNVGLIRGERLSVRDLLVASLVPSGTDADYALAEHLGGGSVDAFVKKMNDETHALGLKNTHFGNPAGLDESGNYSSARDLATIARAAMNYPAFRKIVKESEATLRTQDREIKVFTTNKLLNTYPRATGIKTGTSPEAGPCLVASADDAGESYIAAVLDAKGEEQRFEAARRILEYGFESYEHQPLVSEGAVYGKITLPYRPDESVRLTASEDVRGLVGPGIEVRSRVTREKPPPEARPGQRLGKIEVSLNGREAGSSTLVVRNGYEKASLWERMSYTAGGLFQRAKEFVRGLSG